MPIGELYFVLPDGSERVSGGNVYNTELLRALARTPGAPRVDTLSPPQFSEQLAAGAPGLYFVDSLNLAQALALRNKTAGQRAVLVVHHLPSLEPGVHADAGALALERAALPLFDAFLAASPFTRALLLARGVGPERILLVPPALPRVEVTPAPYAPPLRALVVANLIPRKGVLELLRALAAAVTPDVALTLDLVGRADLEPAYAEAVALAAAPLAKVVHLHGPVPYADMGVVYRRAQLLVSAASMETFGMALLEARAHGLPILALDGGHVRQQFRDGDTGRLVASVPALVNELLALARDPAAMGALTVRAQHAVAPSPDSWELAARGFVAELGRCFS